MARSFDYRGLLYSPEVLGGIGLLTAGMSGRSPDATLPMFMQGMQTASMFKKMQEEEEKKKLLDSYLQGATDEEKALAKNFPQLFIKQKLQKKERKTVKGADGFNYFIDTGERVLPGITKSGERKTIKAADGFNYFVDTGERVLPEVKKTKDQSKINNELTKNFQSLYKSNQTVKNFDIAQTQLNKLFAGAKRDSAAGDLSMIFTYMKVLDPTSVVREGEQATAQNAAGIPERVRNLYNKLITGERLTKKQRQDFVKSGIGLFQSNQVAKDAFQKSFETSFNTYNIDKNNVFFDADIRPKKININGQVQDVPSGTKLINYKITTNAKGFKKGTFVYRTPDGTIFEIEEK